MAVSKVAVLSVLALVLVGSLFVYLEYQSVSDADCVITNNVNAKNSEYFEKTIYSNTSMKAGSEPYISETKNVPDWMIVKLISEKKTGFGYYDCRLVISGTPTESGIYDCEIKVSGAYSSGGTKNAPIEETFKINVKVA